MILYPCPTQVQVRLILAHTAPRMTATGEKALNGGELGRPVAKMYLKLSPSALHRPPACYSGNAI